METKDNSELAIKYLGRSFIVFIICFFIFLASLVGYNTYFSFSQEKIEVRAENSNSTN